MTATVDPDLAGALSGDPRVSVEAIVRSTTGLDELIAALPREVTILHKYRLISSLAVSAPAGVLLRLAESDTVAYMEPVRDVKHT